MSSKRTAADIEAEILEARAGLAQTVDALRSELSPAALASRTAGQVKETAADAATALRGGGLPDDDGRATKVKVALGAAGVAIGIVLLKTLRRNK